MTRSSLVLVALLVVAALAAWWGWAGHLASWPVAPGPVEPAESPPVASPVLARDRQQVSAAAATPPNRTAPDDASGPATSADPALHGVVRELGGGPVAGVRLLLVDAHGVERAATRSEAGGRFRFAERPEGKWQLFTLQGADEMLRLRHPRVRPDAKGAANVWVPPVRSIRGRVLDAQGQPVAGARVATDRVFFPMGMVPWQAPKGVQIGGFLTIRSDEAGAFEIPFARAGRHRLRASLAGQDGSAECRAGDQNVVLQLGVHRDGALVIEGRVFARVSGAPIADARVGVQVVRRSKGGSSKTGVAQVRTAADGRYEVGGLALGEYELRVRAAGYAIARARPGQLEAGRQVIDFGLHPARTLRVRVELPDGSPPERAELRVFDAAQTRLEVPGRMRILSDAVRVDEQGRARLRRLPGTRLRILAVQGDLAPAGVLEVDLSQAVEEELLITLPTARGSFPRTHYFKLLGPDGKPARFEGEVVAAAFAGPTLLSRVEGRWRAGEFCFGHEERHGFRDPTIAVGALKTACRVEIRVPGYATETLTLEAGAKSPTRVRLRR